MTPSTPSFESPLHAQLGLSDADLRQELRAQGLDPASEAGALRSMIQTLSRSHWAPPARRAEAESKRFSLFDEAVAAGVPSPACGTPAQSVNLLELLKVASPESVIWARVSGWSMRGEGINDGDMILVDTRQEARDGDIVLAHLSGEGQLVKRLRLPGNGSAVLESANPDFAPIVIADPAAMAIHGVVIGRAGRL